MGDKLFPMTFFRCNSTRFPPFVLHPTDELRQLGRQLGGFVQRQMVAERVQHCPQRVIRSVRTVPSKFVQDVVQPDICFLNRAVKRAKSDGAHFISLSKTDCGDDVKRANLVSIRHAHSPILAVTISVWQLSLWSLFSVEARRLLFGGLHNAEMA